MNAAEPPAAGADPDAGRLRLLSGGAAQALVGGLAAEFARQSGCTIDGTFSAVGAMKDALLAGAPCDVVILTRALIDQLALAGRVDPGSVADLGTVRTGVAVRSGDPLPPLGDAELLRETLRRASSLYHPDPQLATAGIHFIRVLQGLGIDAEVGSRLRPFPNGATAMRELAGATDARPVGVTQITEIRMTPGVVLAGPLPPALELATTYTAAVCTGAALAGPAQQLVRLLARTAATGHGRSLGFEVN